MIKFAAFIVTIVLLAGCKKAIENKQEDLIIKAMTDGQWVITSFASITGPSLLQIFLLINSNITAIKLWMPLIMELWKKRAPGMGMQIP